MYWNFTDILRGPLDPPFAPSDGEISVEIGFGNGEYLEHLARSRPRNTVVGLEVSQTCITKAGRRALAAGLANIRLLHGDARYLLSPAFRPASVSEAFMNFPCPWPKKRHAGRRVNRPQFVAQMARTLKLGGTFALATDVDWYAESTVEAFAEHGAFEVTPVSINARHDYVTKYERKWLEMGRNTYMAQVRKIKGDHLIEPEEGDKEIMNTCESSAAADTNAFRERLSSIRGDTLNGKDYLVKFREVFYAADDTALVNVITVDEGFEQHYYLKVVPKSPNAVRVQVDSIGHPYKTPGVRASFKHLMEKIADRGAPPHTPLGDEVP